MKEIILAYQGEMTLKGLNRSKFEARLAKSIRYRLEDLGKFKVTQAQSTVFIEPLEDDLDMDEAFRRISKIFGIVKMSRAACCSKDFDEICATAEAYLGETLRGIRTFKVEAKRADKTFPMKSPELCRELGAYLLGKHPHLRVNVHEPQLEIMVEIRDKGAYIHGPKVEAAGGLPVGTSGRALNLLSGGIDSPVAAYCMARRGLALHHIHFASPPYTSLRAKLKVRALARELAEYTGNCQLFVVPYTKPQEYIRDNAPDVLFTVLMRRSMLRIAKLVADQSEMEALITGESLAQVASQTMQAIACTAAAPTLPIFPSCARSSAWIRRRSCVCPVRSAPLIPPLSRMRIAVPSLPRRTPKPSPAWRRSKPPKPECPAWQSWNGLRRKLWRKSPSASGMTRSFNSAR